MVISWIGYDHWALVSLLARLACVCTRRRSLALIRGAARWAGSHLLSLWFAGAVLRQVAVEVAGGLVGDFKGLHGALLALPGGSGVYVATWHRGRRRLITMSDGQWRVVWESGARVPTLLCIRLSLWIHNDFGWLMWKVIGRFFFYLIMSFDVFQSFSIISLLSVSELTRIFGSIMRGLGCFTLGD